VTDASLSHIKAIHKLDSLDVTGTSISDAGIEELRAAFPNAHVAGRRNEPAANDRSNNSTTPALKGKRGHSDFPKK